MAADVKRRGSTRQWRRLRLLWQSRLPLPCTRCGRDVLPSHAWHLDHSVVPASRGGSDLEARPAHAWCNLSAGARAVGELRPEYTVHNLHENVNKQGAKGPKRIRTKKRIPVRISHENVLDSASLDDFSVAEVDRTGYRRSASPSNSDPNAGISPLEPVYSPVITPEPPYSPGYSGYASPGEPYESRISIGADLLLTAGPDDASWNRSPWLDELRDVPAEAYWPRVMSGPHPRAVGSYGDEVADSATRRTGLPLRWWQRLALVRMLEHDADGELVWSGWLLSTARQLGKSWLLRELFLWRIDQAERFGEPQLVLHTGKDLPVCREIQRPARVWARGQAGYTVRDSNGMEEIETPDGSRWLIRGRGSVYGYSASLGAVDEAWHVDTEIVEDGIEPTMVERASAQLGLISTAHRQATALMPDRRTAALEQLVSPIDSLIVEWSASSSSGLGDPVAWRMASPHWSGRRERLIHAKHLRALAGASEDPDEPDPIEAFRTQWLNIWPDRRSVAGDERIEPLLDEAAWSDLADLRIVPAGPLELGLEDFYGRGAGVAAAAELADGRVFVWGRRFDRRREAIAWLELLAAEHAGSTLHLGATLAPDDVAGIEVAIERAGPAQTRAALPRLRDLVAERRIVHDGGAELAGQLVGLRVSRGINGLSIWQHSPRSDLARAAAWCVEAATRAGDRADEPAVF